MKEIKQDLSTNDINAVRHCVMQLLKMKSYYWYALREVPEARHLLFTKMGWYIEESQEWMVLFHIELMGIRPASLVSINKHRLHLRYIGDNEGVPTNASMLAKHRFVWGVQFTTKDKSDYGISNRMLGFGVLWLELLSFLHERQPKLATVPKEPKYHREANSPVLFVSSFGKTMTTTEVTRVVKRTWGVITGKYMVPRLIRFWIGHYLWKIFQHNGKIIARVCIVMNHSIETHLKYYVLSDEKADAEPQDDPNIIDELVSADMHTELDATEDNE